ncbi:hypothetical protein [Angustibacter speluncae]
MTTLLVQQPGERGVMAALTYTNQMSNAQLRALTVAQAHLHQQALEMAAQGYNLTDPDEVGP